MTALTSLTLGAPVVSAQEQGGPPRGADVGSRAGSCGIGPFSQVTKAGPYNQLCEIMSDSEKCLALIKGHFNPDGSHGVTRYADKLRYCLETLENELIQE
jgi:hypothetical protein